MHAYEDILANRGYEFGKGYESFSQHFLWSTVYHLGKLPSPFCKPWPDGFGQATLQHFSSKFYTFTVRQSSVAFQSALQNRGARLVAVSLLAICYIIQVCQKRIILDSFLYEFEKHENVVIHNFEKYGILSRVGKILPTQNLFHTCSALLWFFSTF